MNIKNILYYLLIIMLISGCSTPFQNDQPSVPTATKLPVSTSAMIASKLPTLTAISSTPSLTPAVGSPTATSIPLPTMSSKDPSETIMELQQTNGGCELPCFWGFQLGQTTWQEVMQFYTPFAFRISEPSNLNLDAGEVSLELTDSQNSTHYIRHLFIIEEEKIIRMTSTSAGQVKKYRLSNILSTLGVPNEIRVRIDVTKIDDEFSIPYYLNYSDLGILVQYNTNAIITEENVSGCPRNETNPMLTLWIPSEKYSFFDFGPGADVPEEWVPQLQDISDMTVEEFYETYKNPNTDTCFQTPRDIWPHIW